MDFLKGGLWPMGDYPNLLGITPADRKPKTEEYSIDWGDPFGEKTVYVKTPMRKEDISISEEYSIQHLADRMFAKVKYKPPTFEEFCEVVKIYEDFSIDSMELIYLVEYKDGVVGTLHSKIKIHLDDLGMPIVDFKRYSRSN